ncbi:MAG: hypothetical protein NXI12_01575 [Alphaproteobacteria bacterium]|nr:hypothetical protein [Alphaproteobacteria bacterium]
MGRILARSTNATITIFLAFLLSYAMLVGLALTSPQTLTWLLDGSEIIEDALTHTNLPNEYNNWLRIFVGEEQILFLFFAILARIVIAIVGSSFSAAIGRKPS